MHCLIVLIVLGLSPTLPECCFHRSILQIPSSSSSRAARQERIARGRRHLDGPSRMTNIVVWSSRKRRFTGVIRRFTNTRTTTTYRRPAAPSTQRLSVTLKTRQNLKNAGNNHRELSTSHPVPETTQDPRNAGSRRSRMSTTHSGSEKNNMASS